EGYVPAVPDFALDQHTLEGRKLKRGLTHFREEGGAPDTGADRTRLVHRGSVSVLADQGAGKMIRSRAHDKVNKFTKPSKHEPPSRSRARGDGWTMPVV